MAAAEAGAEGATLVFVDDLSTLRMKLHNVKYRCINIQVKTGSAKNTMTMDTLHLYTAKPVAEFSGFVLVFFHAADPCYVSGYMIIEFCFSVLCTWRLSSDGESTL